MKRFLTIKGECSLKDFVLLKEFIESEIEEASIIYDGIGSESRPSLEQVNQFIAQQKSKDKEVSLIDWLRSGKETIKDELAGMLHNDWIFPKPAFDRAYSMRGTNQSQGMPLERILKIEGKEYKLLVADGGVNATGNCIGIFTLKPVDKNETIPEGYKLRLLTEDLEDYSDNEREAQKGQKFLELRVSLEKGEAIAWETSPPYDGYEGPEILPPFWTVDE